jgi:hypothetical protein
MGNKYDIKNVILKGLNSLYNELHGLNFEYNLNDDGNFEINVTPIGDKLPLINKIFINKLFQQNIIEFSKYLPDRSNLILPQANIFLNGEEINYDYLKISDKFQQCIDTFFDSCKKVVNTNSRLHDLRYATAHINRVEREITSTPETFQIYATLITNELTFDFKGDKIFVTEERIEDYCDNSDYAEENSITYDDMVTAFVYFFNNSVMNGEQYTKEATELYDCSLNAGYNWNDTYMNYYLNCEVFLIGIGDLISKNPYDFVGNDTYPNIYEFVKYFKNK